MSTQHEYEDYATKLTEPHRLTEWHLLRCVIIAGAFIVVMLTIVWSASAQHLEQNGGSLAPPGAVQPGGMDHASQSRPSPGTRSVSKNATEMEIDRCDAVRNAESNNLNRLSGEAVESADVRTAKPAIAKPMRTESRDSRMNARENSGADATTGIASTTFKSSRNESVTRNSIESVSLSPPPCAAGNLCGRSAASNATVLGEESKATTRTTTSPSTSSGYARSVIGEQTWRDAVGKRSHKAFALTTAGYLALSGADFYLSNRCIQAHRCVEIGSYRGVASHPLAFGLVKMGASSALAATAWSIRKKHPKAAWGVMVGLTVAQAGVVYWNSQQGRVR